jgi:hypothetical protein
MQNIFQENFLALWLLPVPSRSGKASGEGFIVNSTSIYIPSISRGWEFSVILVRYKQQWRVKLFTRAIVII